MKKIKIIIEKKNKRAVIIVDHGLYKQVKFRRLDEKKSLARS